MISMFFSFNLVFDCVLMWLNQTIDLRINLLPPKETNFSGIVGKLRLEYFETCLQPHQNYIKWT